MPEQLKEHILDDVLGDFGSQAERADVAPQTGRTLVEQVQHLLVRRGRGLGTVSKETRGEGRSEDRRTLRHDLFHRILHTVSLD